MSDEVTRQAEELSVGREDYNWMVQNRNEWQDRAVALGHATQRMTEQVERLTADVARLTEERDNSRKEASRLYEAGSGLIIQFNVALADVERLTAERDAARAEAEGLRADLLAHPPSYHQELAIERKRHVELIDDYNLQTTMIETLQEALKRTEALLAKAQIQDIDPRLKGFLATISQLADQSQDLLP